MHGIPSSLGIQVHEERGPEQSISRAATALTAFVGRTLRGPLNSPIRVESFTEFQQGFGGLWQPSPLGYAVEQFFDNGGKHAIIVRVANGAKSATLDLRAGADFLRFEAARPGTREFLRACVDYDNIPAEDTESFNLTVQRVRVQGTQHIEDQEIFRAVRLTAEGEDSLVMELLDSELVRLRQPLPSQRPDCTLDPTSGLATGYVMSNSDGDDGAPLTDYDVIGSAADRTGVFALDHSEEFNFLCIPPLAREQDVGVSSLLVAARYCKERRALLIVDPPMTWTTAEEALQGLREWALGNENAFMYFPRILAHDKLRGRFESFAPCGAVAGMLARSDAVWPVWAPAEGDEAVLRPAFRPNCLVTEDRRLRLASAGVNTLQSIRSTARVGSSPRTLAVGSAGSSDWKYLPTRRLALFVLNCIERGTRWVMFARGDPQMPAQLHDQVTQFLTELHREGAFSPRPLDDAFVVICDERIDTFAQLQSDPSSKEFHFLVGFAAPRAGEFHTYIISHSAHSSRVQPTSINRLNSDQYRPFESDHDLSGDQLAWVEQLAGQFKV